MKTLKPYASAAVALAVIVAVAFALCGAVLCWPVPEVEPLGEIGPRHFVTRDVGAGLEILLPDAEGFDSRWYPVVVHNTSPVVRYHPPASERRDTVAAIHQDGAVTLTVMGPGEFTVTP